MSRKRLCVSNNGHGAVAFRLVVKLSRNFYRKRRPAPRTKMPRGKGLIYLLPTTRGVKLETGGATRIKDGRYTVVDGELVPRMELP